MNQIFAQLRGDKVIWMVVFLLSVFSIMAVYSSTGTLAYRYQSGNTEYYLIKQFVILLFGFAIMYFAHLVKYTYYSRISQIAVVITIPLLIFTLFSGTNINEANRWITLPLLNMTFQSSDLAKLALIMYVARLLSKKQDQIKDFNSAFIPIMLPVIGVCGLILPANFSTAALLFFSCFVMMFIGRINFKYLMAFTGIGIIAFTVFIFILLNSSTQGRLHTWKNRVESFVNNDTENNYQAEQSKIAIASGGFFGKMPGNGVQKNFIPHPYSDFIFAVIIEEFGLIGAIILILLYMILFFRAVRIVTKCPGTFGSLLVSGIAFLLVFQALINMAVAVNLLPVTGQPLPLVSMGGTSIWFTCLSIGIILSVSRSAEEKEQEQGGDYVAQ